MTNRYVRYDDVKVWYPPLGFKGPCRRVSGWGMVSDCLRILYRCTRNRSGTIRQHDRRPHQQRHVITHLIGIMQSVAIGGNRWQSVAIGGNRWQSVAIGGNRWQSVAIGGAIASDHINMVDNHIDIPYPISITRIPYRNPYRCLIDIRYPISTFHIDLPYRHRLISR